MQVTSLLSRHDHDHDHGHDHKHPHDHHGHDHEHSVVPLWQTLLGEGLSPDTAQAMRRVICANMALK